ncbi:MAG: PaaI family thioesterase [Solidesulfovibrio sp.]
MDYNIISNLIENGLPFQKMLGIKVSEVTEGRVKLFIPFREDLIGDTRRPALHGGVISTLADVCAGFAVWTRCRLTDRIATIDLLVDYLHPATAHDLYAEATVNLLGNRVGNAQVVLWSDGNPEQYVAKARGVYNIRRSDAASEEKV